MSDRNPPRVVDTSGGRSIFYCGKQLYNTRDPRGRAQARARSTRSTESTLYLLASPLLWHGVAELLDNISSSSQIVALEIDDQLRGISTDSLPNDLAADLRLHFYKGPPHGRELLDFIRNIGIEKFRSCELLSLNGGYRLHPREYGALRDLLREEIESFWKNKMTLIHMAPLWVKNIFTNVALYHRHFHHSPNYGETPVLVVGAGPSAEKILEPLRKLRASRPDNELRIVAVDTAFAPLIAMGIVPDMVVAQEAQFYNVYDFLPVAYSDFAEKEKRSFKPYRNPGTHSFFSYDLTSSPLVPRLRNAPDRLEEGRCGFFLTRFFPTKLFDRLDRHGLTPQTVPPLGSVGSTAVELALGCSTGPVYVCGLDFSFFYGKSHMRGSTMHLLELTHADRFSPVGSASILFPAKSVYPLESNENLLGKETESRVGPKRIRTGLLGTYAATFSDHFSPERERLYTVAHEGADLGLRELSPGEFMEHVKHNKNSGKSRFAEEERAALDHRKCPKGPAYYAQAEAAGRFLHDEAALLRRVYEQGCRRLSADTENESLEELVNEADYLFHHFPDTGYDPPKELDSTMIKRILVSAGHYSRIIERALALLESGRK